MSSQQSQGTRVGGSIARRLLRPTLYVTPVLALLVLTGLAAASPSMAGTSLGLAGSAGLSAPSVVPTSQLAPPTVSSAPSGSGAQALPVPAQHAAVSSSGPGTFFNTSAPALPPVGNQWCYYGTSTTSCANITYDPSINYTSRGVLAVAYTAYSNETPCASSRNYSHSVIGFSTSTNKGSSWSTPIYLGNTQCDVANATNFTSAWQPSLSSLSNGTLVLAFIEFNVSGSNCYFDFLPNVQFNHYQYSGFGYDCYNVPSDRLVVTESYDNGTTWTNASVLNTSYNFGGNESAFAPQRPSVATSGNTIYVAWYNLTADLNENYSSFPYASLGSTQVHMVASTDGGATWGPMRDLTVYPGNGAYYAENPALLVLPSGQVDLFYASAFDYWEYYGTINGTKYSGIWTASIYMASSTNNGSTFSYSVVVNNSTASVYRGSWEDPAPSVAYSSYTNQLYVAYGGNLFTMFCSPYCYNSTTETIYVANSSNGGSSWTDRAASSLGGRGHPYWQAYNPAIGVGATGTVYLEAYYQDDSQTFPWIYGTWTGGASEIFLNSTDNATTFNGPFQIGNASAYYYSPNGNYGSMAVVGNSFYAAYALPVCPAVVMMSATYYYCDWYPLYYPSEGFTNVTIATEYNGTGITLTYSETGLVTGTNWSVNLMGNLREAAAPTSLSISGVPINTVVSWNLANPNGGYGVRYSGSASVSSPASFSSSTTITIAFTEQVMINLYAVPSLPPMPSYISGCYGYDEFWYDNPYCASTTYNVTATSGGTTVGPSSALWVDSGAVATFNVTSVSMSFCAPYAYCYATFILNLTFESWTGTGNGSFNTTTNYTSVTANTPFNETANFDVNGWCYYYFSGAALGCVNSNASIYFTQSGLPANVTWNVTLRNTIATQTASGTSPILAIRGNATLGVPEYYAWSVPSSGGKYWVGTGNPPSPIELPMQRVVNINYTLINPNLANFPVLFNASGLPNDTAWSLELTSGSTSMSYGIRGASWLTQLQGGQYAANGSTVYLQNGTAYYASAVTVTPYVVNESATTNLTTPAGFVLAGASVVTVHYSPMYWLTVSANAGGTAGPANQWVVRGQTVNLTASADSTHMFVGWTGIGLGSLTSTRANISVRPTGPVEELATFQPIPPALAEVSIAASGLPSGTNFTITVGNMSYSGAGTVNISLIPGSYEVQLPIVYLNGSELTRFIPTVNSTSYASTSEGLNISGDGMINLTYTTQYQLTLAATGPGTISPTPGTAWYDAGSSVAVTGTPQSGYMLLYWNGTGTGAVNATKQLSVTLILSGPVSETAFFVVRPPTIPATYHLDINASNLPSGASWSAAVPGNGASGTASMITITGLNGTYTLSVPDVYTTAGVRYVANDSGNYSVSVAANRSFSVSFSPEYLVGVIAGQGGNVSGLGGWYASGASVQLTATPNSTSTFLNWTGTGTASVSSTNATISVTVTGPLTETAIFGAKANTVSGANSTTGMPIALGLLIALLLVGLIVGLLVGRRRARGRAPPQAYEGPEAAEETPMEAEGPAAPSWEEGTGTADPSEQQP